MNREVGFMKAKTQAAVVLAALTILNANEAPAATTVLVGWSETGLHETDGSDVSVYTLAPPFSTIHAQLISGGLLVTNPAGFSVTYEAVADSTGSINTTSQGKGNFHQYAQPLFGTALAPDQGLAGFGMPGTNNQPQKMTFDSTQKCFTAQGIPITPYDDLGHKNYLPLMRLVARDSANNILATAAVALPVTDEMDCRACHASGSQTAARPPSGWAWKTDPQKDYKFNVLQSHDDHLLGTSNYATVLGQVGYNQAGLVATVVKDGHPVSCVRCHTSAAVPGTGAPLMRPLTVIMHTKHSYVSDPKSGADLTSMTNSSACLLCHAGPERLLTRGVHHNTINADGSQAMQCENCHGPMSTVGSASRQGWLDEPSCQSCHTGTATANKGSLRFTSAFDTNGLPRTPQDLTFATQANSPSVGLQLYHTSLGHGGLNCAACHGSAHAELLSYLANDNAQSLQLQTGAGGGVLTDCAICHTSTPSPRLGGPHGMHPVDANWAYGHDGYLKAQCQTCHGVDERGTVLSRAQENRTYGAVQTPFWHGFEIGCYTCHNGPNGGDVGVGISVPLVSNLAASTMAGSPINITLAGSDPGGSPVSLRIVSQPAHGTVSLAGNLATFYPDPTFAGSDSFTYAAWNGSVNSSLGTVALTTTSGPCVLSASALVPTAALPNSQVPFSALASLSQCSSTITYDWDFGDGSPHPLNANASHTYTNATDYTWVLKATAGNVTQKVQGVVTISPTLGQPIALVGTSLGFMFNLSWPADAIPTALEAATDLTQPYAWQPDFDPVYFDGTNNNVQVFFLPGEQLFRVRRLP